MAARVGLLSLYGPQDEAADCARARAMKIVPQAALRVTQRLYVHVPGAALLATPGNSNPRIQMHLPNTRLVARSITLSAPSAQTNGVGDSERAQVLQFLSYPLGSG